jgi:hypothetical protein
MKQLPIGSVLRQYDRGHITRSELDWRLVQAAATMEPEELLPLLSVEQIELLRTLACSLPKSLEDAPRFFAMGMTIEVAHEERRLWFDGIRRWHLLFKVRE